MTPTHIIVLRGRSTAGIAQDAARHWPVAPVVVVAAPEDRLREAGDMAPADVVGLGGPIVLVANGGTTGPLVRTLAALRRRGGAWTAVDVQHGRAPVWLDGTATFGSPSRGYWDGASTEGLPVGSIVYGPYGWGVVAREEDVPYGCDCCGIELRRVERLAIVGGGE